jgi:hypothetical protein
MTDPINKLQEYSYPTRVKILWATFLVVAIGLTGLIIQSIKSTVTNAGANLTKVEFSKLLPESKTSYVSIERVERTDNILKIYFNINNTGNDILNVPKLTDIDLKIDDQVLNPQRITDRQGKVFAQKVLSYTQAFGILFFPKIDGSSATLTFDGMFLERDPVHTFRQTINLDLDKLSKQSEVRN